MSRTSRSKGFALVAIAGAAALVLSACGSSDNGASTSSSAAATTSAAASEATSSAADTGASTESSAGSETAGSETGGSETGGSETGGSETSAAENTLVGSDDDYCDVIKKNWAGISGKTVTVYTGISGVEADGLKTSFKAFEDCSGAKVELNSDKN